MSSEFPEPELRDHQKEFLRDWWTPKKLFIGPRASGKTTMLLCELRRMQRYNFSCILIAPSQRSSTWMKELYYNTFNERMTCSVYSADELKNGNVRGRKLGVILIDEIQKMSLEDINREILPMDPMFIRATANEGTSILQEFLERRARFFDTVYEY